MSLLHYQDLRYGYHAAIDSRNRRIYGHDYRYHQAHEVQARQLLQNIEAAKGKMNHRDRVLCDSYAQDKLGHLKFAPWLYVYTAVAGKFKEGWIPDNYYGKVVAPRLKGAYGDVSALKALTRLVLNSDAIPDLAYAVNGLFLNTEHRPLTQAGLIGTLFDDQEKVVFKVDSSRQGKGVYFLSKNDFDVLRIGNLGNGVFQKYINQHPLFDEFTPNSVATLRMTTTVDDHGEQALKACYLRLGSSGDTHVQSASHIRVPIDLSTGKFSTNAYLTSWLTIDTHPGTNVRFADYSIPCFTKCRSTVLELHSKMPFVRCVGWDVAIDSDEQIRIMEWNGSHNDIKFSEATQGPCFTGLGWEDLWRS